jgi:hypothetical protein
MYLFYLKLFNILIGIFKDAFAMYCYVLNTIKLTMPQRIAMLSIIVIGSFMLPELTREPFVTFIISLIGGVS